MKGQMVTKTIFLVTEHHDSLAEWNVSVQQSTGQRSCIYGGVTSIAETRERRCLCKKENRVDSDEIEKCMTLYNMFNGNDTNEINYPLIVITI